MKLRNQADAKARYDAVLKEATQLLKILPQRELAPRTQNRYRAEFARMMKEPELNPFRPGDKKRTFYYRRAAMHFGAAEALRNARRRVLLAGREEDRASCLAAIEDLAALVARLGPAIARDPPEEAPLAHLKKGIKSRWVAVDTPTLDGGEHVKRGGSKRALLKNLPRDWQDTFWRHVQAQPKLALVTAVEILIGCRPVELTPRTEATGVLVRVTDTGALTLTVAGAKIRQNTGQPHRSISLDPDEAGAPAEYLADMAHAAGGKLIVRITSTRTWHRQVSHAGQVLFPQLPALLSPIVFRHQLIADLKMTYGAGGLVAAASGHISDVSQQYYGRRQYGRDRKGILEIKAARKIRIQALPRIVSLAERDAPGLRL